MIKKESIVFLVIALSFDITEINDGALPRAAKPLYIRVKIVAFC